MKQNEDLILAELALERGLVTSDEVRACWEAQEEAAAVGHAVPLGQLLIKRRVLDVETFVALAQQVRDCIRAGQQPSPALASLIRASEDAVKVDVPAVPKTGLSTDTVEDEDESLRLFSWLRRSDQAIKVESGRLSAPSPPPLTPTEAGRKRAPRKHLRRHVPLTGKRFGKYEILDEIARGGMGVVYRVRDHELMRIVALKVLKDGVHATDKQKRRFKREVATVSKLNHPNIVRIHDVGVVDGHHYFTMDLVEGHPLDELIRRGPLPVRRACEIAEQAARAIHHTHEHGVIHRDLKPANVLIDRQGTPMVTDFGLAKNVDHISVMTKAGAAVGTPYYMPPEQAKGDVQRIDRRVDVYAIGVLLFEMVTSELPFDGETTLEVYRKIMEDPVPYPSSLDPRVDADIDRVVAKAMAKDREDRYQTALGLANDLRRWLDGRSVLAKAPSMLKRMRRLRGTWRARKLGLAAAGLVGAVMVGGAVLVAIHQTQADYNRGLIEEERVQFASELTIALGDIGAKMELARAGVKAGRPREALMYCRQGFDSLEGLKKWSPGNRYVHLAQPELQAGVDHALANAARLLERDLYVVRGRALGLTGRAKDDVSAFESFDEAERLDAQATAVLVRRGDLQLRRREFADARSSYDKALTLDSNAGPARFGSGLVLEQLGLFGDASRVYRQLLEAERLAGRTAVRPLDSDRPTLLARAWMRYAICELEMGATDNALALLNDLVDADSQYAMAYVLRAEARLVAGEPLLSAESDARAAIELDAKGPQGHWMAGRVRLAFGQNAKALESFRSALRYDRSFLPALVYAGVAQIRLGDWVAARESLELAAAGESTRTYPETRALAWFYLGELERVHERFDRAAAAFRQAIALLPRLGGAHLGLARVYIATGDFDQAQAAVSAAKELETVQGDALAVVEGWLALARNDSLRAGARFAEALEEAHFAPEAAVGLGRALLAQGESAAAAQAFVRAYAMEKRLETEELVTEVLSGGPQAGNLLMDAERASQRPDIDAAMLYRTALERLVQADAGSQRSAAKLLEHASKRCPPLAGAALARAKLLREAEPELALEAAKTALAYNPVLIDGQFLAGFLHADRVALPIDRARLADCAKAVFHFESVVSGNVLGLAGQDRVRLVAGLNRLLTVLLGNDDDQARNLSIRLHEIANRVYEAEGKTKLAAAEKGWAYALRRADRGNAAAALAVANQAVAQGERARALLACDKALGFDSTLAQAWYLRARVLWESGEVGEASLHLAQALTFDPRYLDELLNALGSSEWQTLVARLDGVEDVVKPRSDEVKAALVAGLCVVVRQHHGAVLSPATLKEGAQALEQVLATNPRQVAARSGLCYLKVYLGDRQGASRERARLSTLAAHSATVAYVEAVSYAVEGAAHRAVAALQRAQALGFTSAACVARERAFNGLRAEPGFRKVVEALAEAK